MSSEEQAHDMTVIRRFDAPRERVWRAWSDPDEVMRWWGPQGFTSPMCRMDFREGGTTLVCMRSDQGFELFNTWTYRSIVPLERIEFVQGFADRDGNRLLQRARSPPGDLGRGAPRHHVLGDRRHGDRADHSGTRLSERGDR